MIDVTAVDKLFDTAMDLTGRPPGAGMFDRRVLLPLEELPLWVLPRFRQHLQTTSDAHSKNDLDNLPDF